MGTKRGTKMKNKETERLKIIESKIDGLFVFMIFVISLTTEGLLSLVSTISFLVLAVIYLLTTDYNPLKTHGEQK